MLILLDNPCRLFCSDVDDTIIANWGETVLDGTPCTLGTNNMCIDGICKVSSGKPTEGQLLGEIN